MWARTRCSSACLRSASERAASWARSPSPVSPARRRRRRRRRARVSGTQPLEVGQGGVQAAGAALVEFGAEDLPVDVADDECRVVVVQGVLEGGDGDLGVHQAYAVPLEAFADRSGGHAAVGPAAPGHGGGGESAGASVLGEGVEEGVAGGVVAVSGAAEDAGRGGEQDERRQVEPGGGGVEVEGAAHLDPQDVGEPVRGEGADDAVVEDGRGVEDGGQGPVGGNAYQEGSRGRHGRRCRRRPARRGCRGRRAPPAGRRRPPRRARSG